MKYLDEASFFDCYEKKGRRKPKDNYDPERERRERQERLLRKKRRSKQELRNV